MQPALKQNPFEANPEFEAYLEGLRETYNPGRKVLLVQSPQFLFETVNVSVIKNRGYYAFPPTGLLHLARLLKERGFEVEIFDLNYEILRRIVHEDGFDCDRWPRLLEERLGTFEPSFVGVTSLTVYTDLFHTNHPLTRILDHLMNQEKYIVLAGGPTVSNEIEAFVNKGLCHAVFEGEGEDSLAFFMDRLFQDQAAGDTAGVHFPWQGEACQTRGPSEPVTLTGDLTDVFDLAPLNKYHTVGCLNPFSRMMGQDRPYGVFQLNRGCRSNCRFCGVRSFMGKGIRSHRPEDAIREIEYLVEKKGIRHFEILDDDFLARPDQTRALLRLMAPLRDKYGLTWAAGNGLVAAGLTRELLNLMRDSGCMGFRIGFESGDEKMLRKMRKPGSRKIFRRAAALLQDYPEFFVGGNFIIGLFGEETFGQMLTTIRFAMELNLDWMAVTLFQFTSRPNSAAENLKADGGGASDFIPSKDSSARNISGGEELSPGPDVFKLPPDYIPSREEMKSIWLTFNLFGNYINNKNLAPGGEPDKFTRWVEALQISYPDNPYMRLFGGLGRVATGRPDLAEPQFETARNLVRDQEIWRTRFSIFGLDRLLEKSPLTRQEVYQGLKPIREEFSQLF